ncbi:Voltage-gated Ion Channel (VIC) Superfamily [Phytophthora infestans T30-4]|uniref:Voltage-gated Ion Channel (VIC) Superfamily n=1 Tax=Phytophthora infestans (strain T30-4) TaxID=403677 RepID=D0P193_PHYIT|nr:Voltage-gated Ion Channel (VIC) Superfamily [Phytophthora infestans T30-4]EEY54117.1 Voltage-gated Ion Channel (VIC) Superfamily [Phytophthora infestans T30-4]|eukprot:XP_002895936.1 Voltage-gated Ion Channel (VIC) Superfamily [Phytophthora infestans T30-4]
MPHRKVKHLVRVCRRFYRRIRRPVTKLYKKLPWTTRETLHVLVSLYVVLYLFLTIPFRIAFYYEPLETHSRNQWTKELSIFTTLDIVADVVGLMEFVSFYQIWKDAFSQLSASVSFELNKKLTRDANRLKTPTILRRTPSSGLRRRKAKWTIASIGPLSSIPGAGTEDASAERRFVLMRNIELAMEMIGLLPTEVIPMSMGAYNTLHLARITKLGRIYRLPQCFGRIANIYSDRSWVQHLSSTGIDSLVRNIGLCAGLCHYTACGYMLIAHAQCGVSFEACDENVETSWAIRDRLSGATVARKYARTLYWASRTMVLLGYDDGTPVSDGETVYALVVTLLGALFGPSLLATFFFIFRFRNKRYAAFATHVDNAREYLRSQNISRAVRRQVIAYFSYCWSTHHSLDSEEALHLMPKHLQTKVISTLKASRVKQVCFLMKESVEFINLLALALMRRVYSPGDQITEPKFNAQMFFVIRGTVVLSAFNGSNAKECQTGDFFADSCLLFPEKYEEKAVAKTFCELYVLAKTEFDEAVTHFHRGREPEVRDRMAETWIKYSTQLQKTKKLLGLRGGHENRRRNSHSGSSHSVASDVFSGDRKRGVSWQLPGSVFRIYWDTARLIAIVYAAFEVPFFSVFIAMTDDQGVFVEEPGFGLRYVVTLMAEVFFATDLVLRSRYFAYMDQSVMLEVVQPDLIFATYRASGFYLDLLVWLPVGIALDSLPIDTIRGRLSLLRLLRLLRVRELPNLLQSISDYHSISSKTHLVLSLLLGVTLMLHIVGCIWFEMAWTVQTTALEHFIEEEMADLSRADCLQYATRFQNCSWVKYDCYAHIGAVFPLQDPSTMYKLSFAYLRSVYWAIVTLTAVGYGDIVAFSTAESYFAALWIFVGGIINFGVVGAMSSTISNVMATRHHHVEKLNTLNSLLERMNISEKLSAEIRRFYHHQFVEHKRAYESQLLSHLPDQLCYRISSLLHSDAVKSVSLFDSASGEFLHEITGKFRHRSFQHGETICLEGDICREFFVFLHGSKVNVFYHIRKVPIRALHPGDSYGVSEFLLRRTYTATLTAASLVHASVMSREQFDVIQRKFASDLSDVKEEAQVLWLDQQKRMRRVVNNLERLKLQPHMMQTTTLFFQHDTTVTLNGKSGKAAVRDAEATRTTFTSTWNAIVTCWNIYNAFFVIFRICFHSHLHFSSGISTVVWVADLACDLCFALDIYLRLYYFGCPEVGFENLLDRQEKDAHYLHSSTFRWDLLASLPLYAPLASGSMTASLCRLPRLVRCVDLFVYMDDVIVQIQQHFASQNVSAYLSPAKLMIILVLGAHFVGCVFLLISEHECEHVEHCWMAHDHLLHEYHHSVPILYAKSFYWAITTLLLVGSRESVPRDTAGTLWTGITCLGCTFIIGHIVGEISELILELGKETKHYKNRIASFESFATEHDLPATLQERVGFFFRLQFEHTEGLDLQSTVHDLSANLRLKLMLEIYGRAISLLPISRFLTPSQINNLALRLQSELFIPGDNILVEGTYGSRLCTLRNGVAAVFWATSVTSVAILMEGALFGEIAFFLSGQQRLATVKATTSCEVLYVTKHDWRELWTTDGDLSDTLVQKHALYSILNWVHGRLLRYQRASLRFAKKAKPPTATARVRMVRSRSLPLFESKYFVELHREGDRSLKAHEEYASRASIDFEIIQRCQRPQYTTQLQWYQRYRRWRNRRRTSTGQRASLSGGLQLPSDQDDTTDPRSREFIKQIKELGRLWDLGMLGIATYNLIVTPFKLCFATDLTELSGSVLRSWSGFEVFLDILCVIDVGYKIRYASLTIHSVGASLTNSHQGSWRRIFTSNPALHYDIFAMLPLELLLFAADLRVPGKNSLSGEHAANACWWTTRWLLRMNRMLLAHRIESLTEKLFQYLIYDRKISASEAFLYYLRGLASYVTMGHLLACIWFITSELGFQHYGTSWLSTSATFYLESVSLSRKYLRSLLFSMECISTLFYGDILSMNPLELVAEIAITLWSIYIYGALVGAQGELLDAQARREAAFEQGLGELQHYLVENEVPKKLKRQIKSYYARVWRRRRGEKEFAAVAHVSHTLHEDVVLATLRGFAARGTAFRSLDEHFLRGLLVCLEYVVCSEGEEVAMKGDVDRSMYFIAQGRILVKLECGESIRERGAFFGELALLYGVSRLETCVALALTELYRLDHQPYEHLLQDFPQYRERNKLAWTSPDTAAPDRAMLEALVINFQRGGGDSIERPTTASAANSDDVVANAERINADLPYSHISKFIMGLLAQLQRVDPSTGVSHLSRRDCAK